ncbi:MAG TPA: HAD-IIIC family phosphatase, partial [Polyangiales bacterium]
VLTTIPLHPLRRDRLIDYRSKARIGAAFARMNAELLALASKRRTVVLDASELGERAGAIFCDARMRHTASQVYATAYLRAYAEELARIARADLGLAKKVLALDLDNTLWGGVIGDDGVGGIKLGGAYPGTAHLELQTLARDLSRQGVLLTVCSKNEDAIAREAIAMHPEMALGIDAFSMITANWEPKPGNLVAQAERLNLGIDAFVFVDDNPVERGLMREQAPRVSTLEVAREPSAYAQQLAAAGYFNQLELTDEDRARTEQYRAQAQREELSRSAGSLDDYLRGLGQQLWLEPLSTFNAGRIVQLFGKTNQFNLTGRRYGEGELDARIQDGSGWVIAARLSDRFGDNGLIGALTLLRNDDAWAIENFVLSCRVFSRQVEQTILSLVLNAARDKGVARVTGRFVESPKNKKFARFFADAGFLEVEPGSFAYAVASEVPVPVCVKVITGGEAFHDF